MKQSITRHLMLGLALALPAFSPLATADELSLQSPPCQSVAMTIYFAPADTALSTSAMHLLETHGEALRGCGIDQIEAELVSTDGATAMDNDRLSEARLISVLEALESEGVEIETDVNLNQISYLTVAQHTPMARRVDLVVKPLPRNVAS